jgi:hypothetical protein
MKTVIIVSKCLRVTKFKPEVSWYEFHFKGVYSGELVRKIHLLGMHDFKIKKGEEYLMYVQMISIKDGVIKGSILKSRLIDDCWDRS